MKSFLDKASEAYYNGNPIMLDAQFDILCGHFDYKDIGHKVTGGVPHYTRMYSLENCFDAENMPLDITECIKTPKLDGAAISILYVQGKLSLALTRGDGLIGKDITDKVRFLVPNVIKRTTIIQITGEILAPSSIENSRNYASGALNLKDLKEFKTRDLTFVAYDVDDNPFETWLEMMEVLELMGFNVVTSFDVTKYPTDGIVYRINDMEVYRNLGYTSHHPKGAFALKEQKEGVITKLLNVIWQIGKSGKVSPVAILKPVKIGDALVSKATLHNIKYIEDLNLEIGCQVEVIRSGEVIPRIVRRI